MVYSGGKRLTHKIRSWNSWKPFSAGFAAGIILIAILFSMPIKTISVEKTERYYDTVTIEEPYTVEEPYVVKEVQTKSEVLIDDHYISSPAGINVPFKIDRPDAVLIIKFDNPFTGTFAIVENPNRTVWQTRSSGVETELVLEQGDYLARFRETMMWGQNCYIYLALQWEESQQIIRYKEVTKFREVQRQEERERTTIEEQKISLWKHISTD